MKRVLRSLRLVLALTLLVKPAAISSQTGSQEPAPVEVSVPFAPIPVPVAGKNTLVYELHLTNFARELVLSRLEIRNETAAGAPLAVYEGDSLASLMQPLALYGQPQDNRRIGAGVRTIVYLWLTLDADKPLPTVLRHTLKFTPEASNDNTAPTDMFSEATVGVSKDKPVIIGPPLRGDIWLAGNGPDNGPAGHRRTLTVVDGVARLASRFAIDWVQYGKNDQDFTVDRYKNADYYAYGSEVLAVADGVVSSIKDGIAENVPGPNSRAVPITVNTMAGNNVILNLGHDRYAVYAHLQPGSIRVKSGQQIRKGQVLGLVGNSGNSDAPHLHFHICNSNSALGCEGLPYLIQRFELTGQGGRALPNGRKEKRTNEMPLMNDVINFTPVKR